MKESISAFKIFPGLEFTSSSSDQKKQDLQQNKSFNTEVVNKWKDAHIYVGINARSIIGCKKMNWLSRENEG